MRDRVKLGWIISLACIWLAGCGTAPSWTAGPDAVTACYTSPARSAEPALRQGDRIPNLGLVKQEIRRYHSSGQWEAERQRVAENAISCLNSTPDGGRLALVFDIDETALSNWQYLDESDFASESKGIETWILSARDTPIEPTRRLYEAARARNAAVFFITGRDESMRDATEKNLRAAGYDRWDGLSLKPEHYNQASIVPFKSSERKKIVEAGYRIVVNIGDQESDLEGGYAEHTFKLPNPAYYIP